MKNKLTIKKISIYVILIFFGILWLMPISIAISKSFRVNGINNYLYILNHEKIDYIKVLLNSFSISIGTTLIVLIITSLAGFAFSKIEFLGKKVIFIAIVACMTIPVASVTMPLFFTINKLTLIDKYGGVIIPLVAFNAPMMLLIIKNYFDSIPNSIIESATIDGCHRFNIYSKIMLPLSVPIIANVSVLTFVYSWNDYLIPLLMIRSEELYTVTLASQYFMETTYQSPENVAQLYAAMMLMTIPSIIVFLSSQKYLQSGITSGSIKG